MSTQPVVEIPLPLLKCMYPDCNNEWTPRTTRKPKVCPRCKRYGWEVGRIERKKRRGGKHVAKTRVSPTDIGPQTEEFLKQRKKET